MSKPNPGRFPVRRFLTAAIVLACVLASVQTVPVAAKVPPKPKQKPNSRGKIVTPAPVTTIPKQKDYQLIVQGSYEFDLGDGDAQAKDTEQYGDDRATQHSTGGISVSGNHGCTLRFAPLSARENTASHRSSACHALVL